MKTYIIKTQKDLEKFKDEYGYKVDGNLDIRCNLDIQGRLWVDGFIKANEYIKASRYIEAGGSIKAGGYIEAGWYIKAGGYIEASGYIEAGWYIKAGGYIEASWYCGISAGLQITCKTTLSCGQNIFAGIKTWGKATDEQKTITCGELIKGNVEYGILNEIGIPENEDDLVEIRVEGRVKRISRVSAKELGLI